ncbi:MAG TPA: hypothetical protein VF746_29920 [Longimicrobium sp.]
MQGRGAFAVGPGTCSRAAREEEPIARPSDPVDRALRTHRARSRMVSAAIIAVGLIVVLALMFSPGRRRQRAAEKLAVGDDSAVVLRRLGAGPTRCPAGRLDHLAERFPGGTPRPTRESVLEQMRQQTSARWIYPGRRGCTPAGGDAEVGLGRDGKVLWVVPATGRVPLVYPDTLAS